MKTLLHIGEVAQLLGVTTKTIRHYQKIGLLVEPGRTESGYRLYTAQDLLRLQRIKRLQTFGLSLKQIGVVLGDVKQEQTLREVLQSLDQELAMQIQELEERRQKIQMLLAEDTPEAFSNALNTSPSARIVQEHLGGYLAEVSPALWEQELQLYSYLDNFNWSENSAEKMQQLAQQFVQFFVEHPEEYQQMLVLAERFAAIAPLPEEDPAIEQLAQEFAQHFTKHPFMTELRTHMRAYPPGDEHPFTRIFGELIRSVYSPAQEQVLLGINSLLQESFRKEIHDE